MSGPLPTAVPLLCDAMGVIAISARFVFWRV